MLLAEILSQLLHNHRINCIRQLEKRNLTVFLHSSQSESEGPMKMVSTIKKIILKYQLLAFYHSVASLWCCKIGSLHALLPRKFPAMFLYISRYCLYDSLLYCIIVSGAINLFLGSDSVNLLLNPTDSLPVSSDKRFAG